MSINDLENIFRKNNNEQKNYLYPVSGFVILLVVCSAILTISISGDDYTPEINTRNERKERKFFSFQDENDTCVCKIQDNTCECDC